MKRKLLAGALGLMAALTLAGAFAHGGAKLSVDPPAGTPGGTVVVTGSGVEAGSDVEVVLQSARGQVDLGHVDADSSGAFRLQSTLPVDLPAGSYQLVVTGGDEKLASDFSVEGTAVNSSSESRGASPSDAMPAGDGIVYRRSTAETVTAGLVLGLIALLGAGLVVSSRWQGARA